MNPLPNDCARCISDANCPLAATCRRTTGARGDAPYVVMQYFPGGDDCYGYWPEDGKENDND